MVCFWMVFGHERVASRKFREMGRSNVLMSWLEVVSVSVCVCELKAGARTTFGMGKEKTGTSLEEGAVVR